MPFEHPQTIKGSCIASHKRQVINYQKGGGGRVFHIVDGMFVPSAVPLCTLQKYFQPPSQTIRMYTIYAFVDIEKVAKFSRCIWYCMMMAITAKRWIFECSRIVETEP